MAIHWGGSYSLNFLRKRWKASSTSAVNVFWNRWTDIFSPSTLGTSAPQFETFSVASMPYLRRRMASIASSFSITLDILIFAWAVAKRIMVSSVRAVMGTESEVLLLSTLRVQCQAMKQNGEVSKRVNCWFVPLCSAMTHTGLLCTIQPQESFPVPRVYLSWSANTSAGHFCSENQFVGVRLLVRR